MTRMDGKSCLPAVGGMPDSGPSTGVAGITFVEITGAVDAHDMDVDLDTSMS